MKLGENLNGYTIITEPTNQGGGQCMWAFGQKEGKDYFVKEFLSPKYPTAESTGSEAAKVRRLKECGLFEARHRRIKTLLDPTAIGGGNLVKTIDFFRSGSFYYKITDRVEAVRLADLRTLTVHQQVVFLRTLCYSLSQLHRARIVHGDLKIDNVMIQHNPLGSSYVAKVIDFDDSYESGDPVDPEDIIVDQLFGAPELFAYANDLGVEPHELTTASDVFAVGLMVHIYLTGKQPEFNLAYESAGQAVWARQPVIVDKRLRPALRAMLERMLDRDPKRRPDLNELVKLLLDEDVVAYGRLFINL
jgi:eukaryotic-like serine/threonine-protein kinase